MHAHGALALLVSSGACFRIRTDDGANIACRSALIAAGFKHKLITDGEPVASCHIELGSELAVKLRQAYLSQTDIVTDLTFMHERTTPIYEDFKNGSFQRIFGNKLDRVRGSMDPRIQTSLELMSQKTMMEFGWSNQKSKHFLTEGDALSDSRFRHLFREETGISPGYYRQWLQMRDFMRTIDQAPSLTLHALAHGFYDSSHFSNSYRKLLGLSPGRVIRNLASVERAQH